MKRSGFIQGGFQNEKGKQKQARKSILARIREMNQPVNDRKTRKSRGSPGAAFRALLALPEGALFTIYIKSPN